VGVTDCNVLNTEELIAYHNWGFSGRDLVLTGKNGICRGRKTFDCRVMVDMQKLEL